MCGIWALFGKPYSRKNAQILVGNLSARGPEGMRIMEHINFQIGFTRLAINGLTNSGMQPMHNGNSVWVCNGEIYNWKDLSIRHSINITDGSDCSIIGPFFELLKNPKLFFQSLDGVFAMVIVDLVNNIAYVGRDPYGVRPLYVGKCGNNVQFSSEIKALNSHECNEISHFPPGHYAVFDLNTQECLNLEAYHTIPWIKNPDYEDASFAACAIASSLTESVQKRMMTERPVAALLSGGLDSSLVAALVQKELVAIGKPPLKTYSIGFEGSDDLKYARIVADYIKSDHTEIVMTPQQFFDAIPEVIKAIESYDITTVRASVGNYLISREIALTSDCKVVFNGDGSDEVFGGYTYFYNSPSDEQFEYETTRLLEDVHMFDVLRSDRSISSHGLEPRTPFLDKQFVSVAKSVSTKLRRPVKLQWVEKQILRFAFLDKNILPYCIISRKKEAFSDGVSGPSKNWYQECQERSLEKVGSDWKNRAQEFTHLQPHTAEAYYYRTLFHQHYGFAEKCAVPYFWMPRWVPGATDPSARTIGL